MRLGQKREELWSELIGHVRSLLPRAIEGLECELEVRAPEHTPPLRTEQQGAEEILWRDAAWPHHPETVEKFKISRGRKKSEFTGRRLRPATINRELACLKILCRQAANE